MNVQSDNRIFHENLLNWWKNNHRYFPWRETRDPYRILISEIMLHRTRANQVLYVYNDFVAQFPTIYDLANSKPECVKKMLHSLGLFWRNKLILKMSQVIVTKYGGRIPSTKEDLESLPGVSNYIAAAIRCFAFGDAEPLLDTNTVRIVSRILGFCVNDSSRRSHRFRQIYRILMNSAHPREFNYAMIDLGSLVCTSRNPKCIICPINRLCTFGKGRLDLIG